MANPFSWAAYTAPTMTQAPGTTGTEGFWRPADSKLPSGVDLNNYLTNFGKADGFGSVNRQTKYDGALTREALFNSTNFLNQAMGTGFGDLQDAMQYGGNFGDKNSPVYSPTSQNGYGSGWGGSNPFKIGAF